MKICPETGRPCENTGCGNPSECSLSRIKQPEIPNPFDGSGELNTPEEALKEIVPSLNAEQEKKPYFKLSTNEYGKHWLFYKPLSAEPGRYGCWMPIDDEFYNEFKKYSIEPVVASTEDQQIALWSKVQRIIQDGNTNQRSWSSIPELLKQFTITSNPK